MRLAVTLAVLLATVSAAVEPEPGEDRLQLEPWTSVELVPTAGGALHAALKKAVRG